MVKLARLLIPALMVLLFGSCDALERNKVAPDDGRSTQIPVDTVPLSRLTLSPLVQKTAPAVVSISVVQSSPSSIDQMMAK